jgi:hypothetical protein
LDTVSTSDQPQGLGKVRSCAEQEFDRSAGEPSVMSE